MPGEAEKVSVSFCFKRSRARLAEANPLNSSSSPVALLYVIFSS
jgi:hypothetical protein